jgi:hypothetical protein
MGRDAEAEAAETRARTIREKFSKRNDARAP